VHTLSFVVWFWLTTAHVLTYIFRALSLARDDTVELRRRFVPGVLERRALVTGSVILGLIVAIAFLPWDNTWAHGLQMFRGDR
jgi:hypothetical protein